MFTALSEQLTRVLNRLTGRAVLSEGDVTEALREGRPVQEVNRLRDQFQQMRKLMKRM